MTFWNQYSMEPLRKRSFKVQIDGTDGFSFLAKSVNKPTVETDVNEYRLINQVVKFPTVPKWNEITIKYVETTNQGISKKLLKMMTPKQTINSSWTADAIEKHPKGSPGVIAGMTIIQYDAEKNPKSTWKFKNPFIRSINFGDYDYSSDDFVEVEVVVVYDWAYIE
tara:strand:- start:3 stop:500 length:498 start_codon:yes stop_codon:yes gene_type:complete